MLHYLIRAIVLPCSILAAGGFFSIAAAATSKTLKSQAGYDYSHRKRDCDITVQNNGQILSNAEIAVQQYRNHFGFGAAISKWRFDTLGPQYGENFCKYFDYATPENEMKWSYVQWGPEKVEPNYEKADWLISWADSHDILVRGHNLFWNEDTAWIPLWARDLSARSKDSFKIAMSERITSAMTHFKGKVVQWDVLNEIIHGKVNGASGKIVDPGLLAQLSGDNNIFSWVIQQARAIDPDILYAVNDYNIIEQYSDAQTYINKIKSIETNGGKIDIVGLEGHFSNTMNKTDYTTKIKTISDAFPNKQLWLTEIDFSIGSDAGTKIEELMRTCFSNKNIGGIILWVWCKCKMWRDNLTSYCIDSTFTIESDVGKKWRTVREEWKTKANGTTNASGKYSFNGYQGKYQSIIKAGGQTYVDTFYLEPGSGAKSLVIDVYNPPIAVAQSKKFNPMVFPLRINGRTINLTSESIANKQLFFYTYSITGRQLSKTPLFLEKGSTNSSKLPSGCHVIRIGTADNALYTGMAFQLR